MVRDESDDDRLALFNLGRDFDWHPVAEPLLRHRVGRQWKLIWSSEDPRYGGMGTPPSTIRTGPCQAMRLSCSESCDAVVTRCRPAAGSTICSTVFFAQAIRGLDFVLEFGVDFVEAHFGRRAGGEAAIGIQRDSLWRDVLRAPARHATRSSRPNRSGPAGNSRIQDRFRCSRAVA